MSQPGLPALEAFLAVVRHGSFRKAAAGRGVSPSALGHVTVALRAFIGMVRATPESSISNAHQ
ncbi:MAG: helix-turn-helix domain-containing protein [Janthinobacterium lividum]